MFFPARDRLAMQDTPPREEYEQGRFFVEPVIAWRAWMVVRDKVTGGPRLRSITFETGWPEREPLIATCGKSQSQNLRRHHRCPSLACGCGIHAVKTEEQAHEWLGMGATSAQLVARVIGTVTLWGRVLCYTKGYLAEKAYPKRVILPASAADAELVAWLSEGFGVELDYEA